MAALVCHWEASGQAFRSVPLSRVLGGTWMVEEEADHLARGIGPLGISVGARRAAARPSVPTTMDDPVLQHRRPARGGGVEGAAVGAPARYLAPLHCRPQVALGRGSCLRHHLVAVA